MIKTWNGTEWVANDPVSDTTHISEFPPENTAWNWDDVTPQ